MLFLRSILQEDDLIVKVDGKNVYSLYSSNLSELITKSGDSIDMTIIRDGEEMNVTAIRQGYTFINEEEEIVNREGIGIQISYANYNYGFFGSIWRGVVSCGQVVKLIVETLGKLFTGLIGVKGNLAGPVTTIGAISEQTASYGIIGYLSVLAVISISVAFTNILPLPALDGSRIVFVIVEWIRKKPINRKIEGMIHAIGLIVLFSLTILLDLLNYV